MHRKVKNRIDGKNYVVATRQNRYGQWETMVFETYLFGMFTAREPLIIVRSKDEKEAEQAHDEMEVKVIMKKRSGW
ncbi:MAG: hypothetical protein M1269_03435 [Chloroflexi bacterium]|nr:hypothetical protein [Chloroflexota bacterium]